LVDLVAALVADEQSFEVAEPGEGALDDPADGAYGVPKFGRTSQNIRFAGKAEFTHPSRFATDC
jgi:hypothetical protein